MGLSRLRLAAVALVTAVALLPLTASLATPAAARGGEPIVNTEPPVVTGDAVFGTLLQTSRGTWTPDGLTFTFRWARDGVRITGETGRYYRLSSADLGRRVTATVTAHAADGSTASVTTEATARVKRATFANLAAPTVSGVPRFTRTLTAEPGQWSKRPERVRFQWLRAGRPIKGATAAAYELRPADLGQRLRVEVTVRREGYQPAVAASDPTGRVRHRVPVRRSVTYRVETRGTITAGLAQFKRQVQQTYEDPRGWRSAGIAFRPVRRGGTFTVVLAEASWVPRFSPVCSAEWSCRVGRYVIINQTRWLNATDSWNQHGQTLRGYRHMVLNHETGHWLGHGHLGCSGRGRLAPVMMQQSKGLDGCRHNPWPLPSERWSR